MAERVLNIFMHGIS